MKKCAVWILTAALAASFLTGCGNKAGTEKAAETGENTQAKATEGTALENTESELEKIEKTGSNGGGLHVGGGEEADGLLSGKHHVEIEVEDYGTIEVELDADAAPISATNFVDLAEEGFYDGLTFHRIIDGFMIQGGDPMGNGTGGADTTIKGEFKSNGVENDLSHTRGAISMARSGDPDSASSQFFIVQADSPHLDGEYAAFGYVTEGMDLVDKICEDVKAEDNNGTVASENQPVITSVKVID